MLKQIFINTSFEGIHQWKDAPHEVSFLKNWHRHIFNVKIYFEVNHNDRDLEFFIMKNKVNLVINTLYPKSVNQFNPTLVGLRSVGSCEMIADDLYNYMKSDYKITKIEVNEDNENGIEFIY